MSAIASVWDLLDAVPSRPACPGCGCRIPLWTWVERRDGDELTHDGRTPCPEGLFRWKTGAAG
ncbi:hypothetical protein ABZ864_33715 [Streptomyces sp. NPDC047082]|uniref:hypothetical protein n=1 Tax=Streptomyces sp. NPDC047082 TaxID=3155259 RepID=UPI0033EBBF96